MTQPPPLDTLMAWLSQPDRTKRDRIKINPDTGCHSWTGAVSFQIPKAHIRDITHGQVVNLRRLVLEAKLGRRLEGTEFATYTCGDLRCLNPAHLFVASRLEIQRRTKAEGKWDPAKCHARSKQAAITRIPLLFTPRRVREVLMAVHRGEAITTAARSRGMGVRSLQRILSWEIPAALGMDRAQEEARLKAGVDPAAEIRITVAPPNVYRNRWVHDAPPPLFSALPHGAFANGAQA